MKTVYQMTIGGGYFAGTFFREVGATATTVHAGYQPLIFVDEDETKMKRYSKTHQWIEAGPEGTATVGVTRHAVSELGEIGFVEMPDVGVHLAAGDCFAVLESAKAAAEAFLPAAGTISETNAALEKDIAAINADPEGAGWICRLTDVAELPADLMDAAAYEAFLRENS